MARPQTAPTTADTTTKRQRPPDRDMPEDPRLLAKAMFQYARKNRKPPTDTKRK